MPTAPPPTRPLTERLRGLAAVAFGVDLRSLALLRALLAILLIVDVGARLADLRVFYTDSGVLPRSALTSPALVAATGGLWRVDLHAANGTSFFIAGLFILELLAAIAFLKGWHTRTANLVVFVLHASLLNRNPLVALPGDTLLCCLLFWSLFLPMGARWSVDAALAQPESPPPADHRLTGWPAAALLLQGLSVWFFGALLQLDSGWSQGDAFATVLRLDAYARIPGQWLAQSPDLVRNLGAAAQLIALCAPLLALLPVFNGIARLVALVPLAALTIGSMLFLRLGLLPWIELAALSVLIGGEVWDWLARRCNPPRPAPLRLYYDRDCGFCLKTALLLRSTLLLSQMQVAPAQDNARADALLQSHHSWVVIDHDEHAYLKWPALILLLRRSPLFGVLATVLGRGWTLVPGNALYDWIGRRRAGLEALAQRWLPWHQRPFAPGRSATWITAPLLLWVLVWNLDTVGTPSRYISRKLATPLELLRLDQRWDAFARLAHQGNGWLVVSGEMADSTEIDLLHPDRPVLNYDRPVDMTTAWPNLRWRSYFEQIAADEGAPYRPLYGHALCRHWNAHHGGSHQLRAVKLIDMLDSTTVAGAAPRIEQRVLWREECLAPTGTDRAPELPLPEGDDDESAN